MVNYDGNSSEQRPRGTKRNQEQFAFRGFGYFASAPLYLCLYLGLFKRVHNLLHTFESRTFEQPVDILLGYQLIS